MWTDLNSHLLTACSSVEFEAGSSEPHLTLTLGFANKLSGEADARGKVRVSFHLQDDVVNNVVHGCWGRQELRE